MADKPTRRTFLEWLGVGAGAVVLNSCAGVCGLSDTGQSQLNKQTCRDSLIPDIRDRVLDKINIHRADLGLQEVTVDSVAEEVAQEHAAFMLNEAKLTHWDADGLPYVRHSLAGGVDAVSENIVHTTGIIIQSTRQWVAEAARLHDQLFFQNAPYDADKQNIIHPAHNRVGIGAEYLFDPNKGGVLYLVENYASHYVDLPTDVVTALGQTYYSGDTLEFKGDLSTEATNESATIDRIAVHWEPFHASEEQKKLRPNQLPAAQVILRPKLVPRKVYPDGGRGEIEIEKSEHYRDQSFNVTVNFDRGPGVYTICMWLKNEQWGEFMVTSASVEVR